MPGYQRHEGVLRVIRLLREMESGKTIRTPNWARRIGRSVRTARRDITILELAGYPIYEPRQNSYRLVTRDAGDAEDDE